MLFFAFIYSLLPTAPCPRRGLQQNSYLLETQEGTQKSPLALPQKFRYFCTGTRSELTSSNPVVRKHQCLGTHSRAPPGEKKRLSHTTGDL